MRSRVPVRLLVILNSASKSYTISWVYQNLFSRVLNNCRDLAADVAVVYIYIYIYIYIYMYTYFLTVYIFLTV